MQAKYVLNNYTCLNIYADTQRMQLLISGLRDFGISFLLPLRILFLRSKKSVFIHSIRVIRVQLCATLKINKSPTRKS